MSALNLGFSAFTEAAKKAPLYYVRPYGIYHKGEAYWSKELPRKKGSVVRYFEDTSGPCLSLCVFDLDGRFLCNAWPISWEENDHPAQHEMAAEWALLSDEEKRQAMGD